MAEDELVAIAERLQGLCLGRGLTVATAESCTGGLIGATITAVAGSSGYFRGGIVAYADDVKASVLDVGHGSLDSHGAVSAQVAVAMAQGARARIGTDLAVSVTGIAGPDGGTTTKPVGLTYIAVATTAGVEVRRHLFQGDRDANRRAAAAEALTRLVEVAQDADRPR